MKRVLWFLLNVFIVVACDRHSVGIQSFDMKVIECNLKQAQVITNLSSVCDSVLFIHLDESAIVGTVQKMIVDENDLIYVNHNNKIDVFNINGEYITKIENSGRAKSEYLSIDDFSIYGDTVLIVDTQRKNILLFSNKGEYISTISLYFYPQNAVFINNHQLAINTSGGYGYKMVIFDIDRNHVINQYFAYQSIYSEPVIQPFVQIGTNTVYKLPFSNYYYGIRADGALESSYLLDFGQYNVSEKDLKTINVMGSNIYVDSEGNANISRYNEIGNYHVIEFDCKKISDESRYILFVEKERNSMYLIDSEKYKDDVTFYSYRILPDFSVPYKDGVLGIIYPSAWKPEERRNCPFITDELITDGGQINNPIICYYHIRASI